MLKFDSNGCGHLRKLTTVVQPYLHEPEVGWQMLCARKEVHVPTTSCSRQINFESNKCAETVMFADFLHE